MRIIFAVVLSFIFCAQTARCQDDKELPYIKNPGLPAFNIREMDSVNIFNTYYIPKGTPSILIFFSPECKHCQAFFRRMLPGMDSLKNVNFYLATQFHDFAAIRKFYNDFNLQKYPNIKVIGRDYEYFAPGFYKFRSVPDLVLYDRKKKFVHFFDEPPTASDIYKYTHKL